MALELKQSIRLSQQLVVTPQLQQAIKLLQLSRLELSNLIQKELLENPVLEDAESQGEEEAESKESNAEKHEQAKEEDRGHDHTTDEVGTPDGQLQEPSNFDWESYIGAYNAPEYPTERDAGGEDLPTYENMASHTESLHDHLLWQLHLSNMPPRDLEIGTEIIGNINDDGYLKATIDEISSKTGASAEEAEKVLRRVQEFDPLGVAARDITECLMIQAGFLGEDSGPVSILIRDCLPELESRNYAQIAKKLSLPLERVRELVQLVSGLEPKPGRPFSQEQPQYITPDVYVQKVGDEYLVSVNDDGLPRLRISDFYRRSLMKGSAVANQTKEYIQDRLRSAVWLIKSIHQRQRTLFRVTTSIVKFQRDFFDKGMNHLKPLVLKEVAEDIEMHESTISRVTANKYMHSPRGIFELKFFFNSGINCIEGKGVASEVVKLMVKKLIAEEDSKKPYSDQEIAELLKKKNIDIARRTVAKYRETLGILPSSRRRRTQD
ncbi:MAG TPA: RNA polymerase factor sigma-54 [bacterium]|nr:RNA polymerase factor sigma-54 [bacterium]